MVKDRLSGGPLSNTLRGFYPSSHRDLHAGTSYNILLVPPLLQPQGAALNPPAHAPLRSKSLPTSSLAVKAVSTRA